MSVARASDLDSASRRDSSPGSTPVSPPESVVPLAEAAADLDIFMEEDETPTAAMEEEESQEVTENDQAPVQEITENDQAPVQRKRHVSLYTEKGDEIIIGQMEHEKDSETDDFDTDSTPEYSDRDSFEWDSAATEKRKIHVIQSQIIDNDGFNFDEEFIDLVSIKSSRSKKSIRSMGSWKQADPDIDQLLEFGEVSESESDSETELEGSYLMQKELTIPTDFFEDLGDIGDISLISSASIVSGEAQKLSLLETQLDHGRFVNSISGLPESSEEELDGQMTIHEPVIEEEAEEEEEEEEDLMLPSSIEDDFKPEKIEPLSFWQEFELPISKIRLKETSKEEQARLEEDRQKNEMVLDFLNTLIDAVVEKSEYIDPNIILRKNLDKSKLMFDLTKTLESLDIEQKARFFLNRKTVEYYRRRKAFRSITEDNPDTITMHMERYKEATNVLDHLLTREGETRIHTDNMIDNLEAEVMQKTEEANESQSALEDMIRNAFQNEKFTHLNMFVENQLSKMSALRNEITQERLVVIQRQHTLAMIVNRVNEMDNLGDGLHMSDFDRIQTETLALSKKIEERNTELNKYRTRCNADLHILAHLKEKQQMLRNTNFVRDLALQELLDERKETREMVFQKKIKRAQIRNDIKELSFQGGLLDKPALMIDYDETMERLVKMRARVEHLRQKHHDLQLKIDVLENKCKDEGSIDATRANN